MTITSPPGGDQPGTATPYAIRIASKSFYLAHESAPEDDRYVFAYTITIHNAGSVPAQLLSRHWIVTDAGGEVQEVQGDGVVGKQPRLAPGEQFEYTSAAMIKTPVGSMHGSYRMRADDGTVFDAPIPAFRLALPRMVN